MPDLTSDNVMRGIIPTRLLWLDMEMGGLDPEKSKIYEIAGVVTDFELNVIEEFEFVVHMSYDECMPSFSKWWLERLSESEKLAKACAASKLTLQDIEKNIIDIIKRNWKDESAVLAGSSIRMDRNFIDFQMPLLSSVMHYRTFDVSSFKIWFEGNLLPKKLRENGLEEGEHRALSDIYDSIELLKYYISKGWLYPGTESVVADEV